MKRRTFLAATVSVAATSCAAGATVDPATPTATPSNLAARKVADLGPITLQVWDQEVRGGQNEQIEALNAQFQTQYPNITVRRLSQKFDDLRKQTSLALSGDDVPDVVQVNNSRADMGELVAAGQLLSLEPYAKVFGWEQRFPASVLTRMRVQPDAVTFGAGDLFGVPQTGTVVGFFFRQPDLDELGGEWPTSWDGLFELLAAARGAGLQPMALGNLEKWPAMQVLGALQPAFVSSEEATKLALGVPGADWGSEGNLQALAKLAAWGAENYFGDAPNSTDYEAARRHFADGKAAFLPASSALAADLAEEVGDGLRFMAPPPGIDGVLASPGGTGVPWSIPAKAANPEAAAAYLDFITSPSAMETIAASGGVPVLRTAELAPETGVIRDVFEAFTAVSTQGVLVPSLDNATPTFGQVGGTAVQELIAGQRDPESTAAVLQAEYAAG
ncbi:MAG: extracellular solute-binding protein [Propionibacteriaceae bacterium]|nr:extracellular solute-binding protein [Propionibacteriaceae bacterium]